MNATDNWQPGPFPTLPESPTVCSGKVCFDAGAPDDANGLDGSVYINITNGNIYTKSDGTWTLTTSGGGPGGGTVQVYEYTTTDPTTDGVVPDDQDSPAIAYKRDGTNAIYVWNVNTHVWA